MTLVSSGYDLGQQVAQIDNFIAAKVDMIILNAADSKGIGPAVKRAKEAGIVVVAVDVAAEGADATITSDNTRAGELACKYISDRLNNKGNVVIINGPPVSAVQNRVEGCETEFKKHPDIKILSANQNAKGSREGGPEVMTSCWRPIRRLTACSRSTIRRRLVPIWQRNRRSAASSSSSASTAARTAKRR